MPVKVNLNDGDRIVGLPNNPDKVAYTIVGNYKVDEPGPVKIRLPDGTESELSDPALSAITSPMVVPADRGVWGESKWDETKWS